MFTINKKQKIIFISVSAVLLIFFVIFLSLAKNDDFNSSDNNDNKNLTPDFFQEEELFSDFDWKNESLEENPEEYSFLFDDNLLDKEINNESEELEDEEQENLIFDDEIFSDSLTFSIPKNCEYHLVTKVYDGDTIGLANGERVRYIGIDTPETVHPAKPVECFGREASAKNKELVLNKKVCLVKDVTDRDRYKRLLRYVYLDDKFINLELVKLGYATSYSYPPDISQQHLFIEAQKQAREQELGLWSACNDKEEVDWTGGCLIKGNISSGGKIYHLPNCGSYDKTVIDESVGERWFCSEQEATEAGWRKALNCE